ncbi:MAG: ComEA family DNA-binding protein [Cyclobacteriaceae bacterium]
MRWLILFWVGSIILTPASAQDIPPREYDLEKLAETIFPIQDLDIDYSQLYENLAQILSNPLDLNTTTAEELRSLYVLNEKQINSLINYRNENGPFVSIYELQVLDDFDPTVLELIIPFVTIRTVSDRMKSLPRRILDEKNSYWLTRFTKTLETRRGYTQYNDERAYAGSPYRLYTRYRTARASDFSFGFTAEKDPGEQLKWSPSEKNYGFDYLSAHAQLLNKGKLENVIIGDFQSQFGQGLIFGGGFGGGKGAETITTLRRTNIGFLPYTSLNESGFFRGAAVSLKATNRWKVHTFASSLLRDGSLAGDSTSLFLSSVPTTGLHRTETEIRNRKSLRETNLGTVLSYDTRALQSGIVYHYTHYGFPILPSLNVYNGFYFRGSEHTNIGAYLNYNFYNTTFFSEFAQTYGSGRAAVAGLLTSLTTKFDVSILYRRYDKDFHSFYGNAVSENTAIRNEMGYYLGWKYKFNKRNLLAGYTDFFRFPWIRYRGYAPSDGHEYLLRYTYQPRRDLMIYFQVREESKVRNTNSENLYEVANGMKRNYWINADYSVTKNLSFKTRVQFSNYALTTNKTHGFAVIQDLNLSIRRLSISSRFALFDTDDFDNRQYIYEKDVWLAYSFPFYQGVGVRHYVLLQYSISKKLDFWIKWSRFSYENIDTISSGNESIEGNSVNDIKLQLRVKL